MKPAPALLTLLLALAPVFAAAQPFNSQEPEAADIPPEPYISMQPIVEPTPVAPAAPAAAAVKDIPVEEMPSFDDEIKWDERPLAKLQGLNKVTAKTSVITIKPNEKVKFGNLDITVKKCFKKPESEKNESVALLEIWDEIPGQTRNKVFYGWMFSSSPALSALEHPIYDVIVLDCTTDKKVAAKATEEKKDDKPEQKPAQKN